VTFCKGFGSSGGNLVSRWRREVLVTAMLFAPVIPAWRVAA
jgi:hypothetical protein